MRRIRLRMIAIAAFFAAILGESLVRRAIALLMCGVFSFSSTTCYTYLTNYNQVNATPVSGNIPSTIRGEKNSAETAQIPRIRKPSLELPLDFRVVRQVPFSSGKREISLVSPSTGTEQIYSTSLPDADKF
ncbi:hypothetical protein [Fortiea contorta]|uniref:hypothetical protein n=1 Tax=Fortiea contorta TaxID=1892405 RepID=UPI0003477233|nr:hypothetical protein [Fortiea contorta]